MLNPKYDRLDYGEILAPPDEYELDFAVGTTYSLDLCALIGVSQTIGLSEETDSVRINDPVFLLNVLRNIGDKVVLFCEAGQIHMPNKVTPLYILLEKMVFSVTTAKHKRIAAYPSFHPKFWLIRYRNEAREKLYRVVVLSKNLTFDRSWDVAYYMDGVVQKTETDKNVPLCDFLRYLVRQLPSDENGKSKAKRISEMIKELPYVQFEQKDKEFYDYEFIPNGVKDSYGEFYRFNETTLFTDTFHEILIMSPFVSGGIIKDFNDRNIKHHIQDARYMLFTREVSLGKLKPEDVSNFEIYVMRGNVIDGETAISEDAEEAQRQDIHAKIFMAMKYSHTDLYLGSLNASHNAVYGNIEFMLRLMAKNRYLNMDKLTSSLFCGGIDSSDNPFQLVSLDNAIIAAEEDKKRALQAVIKNISRSNPKAYVKQEDKASYSINVHFEECKTNGFKVKVRPLLSKAEKIFGEDVLFTGLPLIHLSKFYVIAVSDNVSTEERTLIIPTDGLPEEDREKAVVSSVVSDREHFYSYIAFLLGDDLIHSVSEKNSAVLGGNGSAAKQVYWKPAIYERMLQIAAVKPGKFLEIERDIEYLIEKIPKDGIIPDEFKKLYETFKRAVKLDA